MNNHLGASHCDDLALRPGLPGITLMVVMDEAIFFQIPPIHLHFVIYAILYPLIWRRSRLMRVVMSGGVGELMERGGDHDVCDVNDGRLHGYNACFPSQGMAPFSSIKNLHPIHLCFLCGCLNSGMEVADC